MNVEAGDLREWLRIQQPWAGDPTSRRLRRTAQLASSHAVSGLSRLPMHLSRASSCASDDSGSTPLQLVEESKHQTGGTEGAPPEALPTMQPQQRPTVALLLTQIAPTAPEVNASAAAVEEAQAEGMKGKRRRIAPVLVSDLPLDPVRVPASSAAAGVAGGTMLELKNPTGAAEKRWAAAWHTAPEPATGAQVAAAVAVADLMRTRLKLWISSKRVRRRLAGKEDDVAAT
jgi:hypothetical protein